MNCRILNLQRDVAYVKVPMLALITLNYVKRCFFKRYIPVGADPWQDVPPRVGPIPFRTSLKDKASHLIATAELFVAHEETLLPLRRPRRVDYAT